MANPGPYPMGQPMGQNMGGPPMGQMGMPRPPMRQGTSKIVPVVVSAGLAVGVFCGLLFGVGTGKRSEAAPEKASNNAKRPDDSFTPESMANPNVKIPDKNAPKAAVAAKAGSDAAGSGAPTEPAIKPTKLIVEIKPESAAQSAKVFVDGKPIEGMSADIPLDPGTSKKAVKVMVKAATYKDIEQEVDVEGESVTVKLELSKGRSTPTNPTPQGAGGTGASDGGNTTAGTGAGGGSHSGAAASGGNTGGGNTGGGNTGGGGGNSGAGSKAGGGSKSNPNSNTGKTGKTGKGSGGLIDI